MKKPLYFDIRQMLPIGLTLVVLGIGIAYGLNVLGDISDDYVTGAGGCNATNTELCEPAYNATRSAVEGVAKLPEKLPLIATVIVAVIIIGILTRYLMVRY